MISIDIAVRPSSAPIMRASKIRRVIGDLAQVTKYWLLALGGVQRSVTRDSQSRGARRQQLPAIFVHKLKYGQESVVMNRDSLHKPSAIRSNPLQSAKTTTSIAAF